jgi:hypothetical protein
MSIVIHLLLAIQIAASDCNCSGNIWISGDGLPESIPDYVNIQGFDENDRRVKTILSRRESGSIVIVKVYIGGSELGSTTISSSDYPEIDMLSARLESTEDRAYVTIRYGPVTHCFVNDDGRNRLKILFRRGRSPVLYRTTITDCQSNTQQLGQ